MLTTGTTPPIALIPAARFQGMSWHARRRLVQLRRDQLRAAYLAHRATYGNRPGGGEIVDPRSRFTVITY